MRLLKTYPTEQNMTRRFFSEKLKFQCRTCHNVLESRYRTESRDGVICSQCCMDKLEGRPITVFRDAEPAPKPWMRKKARDARRKKAC